MTPRAFWRFAEHAFGWEWEDMVYFANYNPSALQRAVDRWRRGVRAR
mgnify:FL=1